LAESPPEARAFQPELQTEDCELHRDNAVWLDGRKQENKAWRKTKDKSLINQKEGKRKMRVKTVYTS
jgi:hypothetical protein